MPSRFDGFGRVIFGKITSRSNLQIYDSETLTIHPFLNPKIRFPRLTNSQIENNTAFQGNLIFLSNVGNYIQKTGLIYSAQYSFSCLNFHEQGRASFVKIGIESLRPTEQEILTDGLRLLCKFNPSIEFEIEKTGEIIVYGPGELGLDSALFFLRKHFTKIELRLSEPSSVFLEGCYDTSQMIASMKTLNRKNEIELICEPLEKEYNNEYIYLRQLYKKTKFEFEKNPTQTRNLKMEFFNFCKEKFKWDALTVKSFWAMSEKSPAVLIEEVFSDDKAKKQLEQVKQDLIKGFLWAIKEERS